MPHCAPPKSRKACCSACKRLSAAKPSIVVICAPEACSAGIKQLLTKTPSTNTEHEPHSPSPQPSLVPVNPSCNRNTSSSRSMAKARTVTVLPFTTKVIRDLEAACESSLIAYCPPIYASFDADYLPSRPQIYLPAVAGSN